jgi:hypothetical protein
MAYEPITCEWRSHAGPTECDLQESMDRQRRAESPERMKTEAGVRGSQSATGDFRPYRCALRSGILNRRRGR